METIIVEMMDIKKKLKNPVLIEGLPGIGNVGRVAAGYLIGELDAKCFAELYSPHFLPLVILHNNTVAHMLKCEFYFHKARKGRDMVILTGDSQSISSDGHYEISEKVIDFAAKLGVKDVITIGGFAEGKIVEKPRVIGAVNDKKLLKKYSRYGIDFNAGPIGTIVGASGLLLGMAKRRGMNGLCLMGETVGFPLITDPKAADKVLQVLKRILDIDVDLTKLEEAVKEMEERLKKTEEIYRKMVRQAAEKDKEHLRYIG